MRIDRIKYTVNPNTNDEWIGMEATLDSGELPEAALTAISKKINDWQGNKWFREHPSKYDTPTEIDPEYETAKTVLQKCETKEEAEYQLSLTPFKLVPELKNIVNSKPSNNENGKD